MVNEIDLNQWAVDDGDTWLRKAVAGEWTAIPETFGWSESAAFAHVINGYELAPALGLDDAGDLANVRRTDAETTGAWRGTAIELWICLFFEHRRYRHYGFGPEESTHRLLDALCQQLRAALIEESARGVGPRFKAADEPPRRARRAPAKRKTK